MTKSIAYCTLIASATLIAILASYSPSVLSDNNKFLVGFVTHEFLSILGVILAITIASAGTLHLNLNEIEKEHKAPGTFKKTRAGIHSAAYWLIALFLGAVAVVVIKPLVANTEWAQTIFNGLALIILVWNGLILITITQTIFAIKPE